MKRAREAAWGCAGEIDPRDELDFTVNVGIGGNKLCAKMASDFEKSDKVHTLFPEGIPEKLWPLPAGRCPSSKRMCGRPGKRMKSCLEEYRDCDVKEIAEKYIEGEPQVGEVAVMPGETNATKVRGISNEDTVLGEGRITYDIRFVALTPATDELIQLIINVEAQGNAVTRTKSIGHFR